MFLSHSTAADGLCAVILAFRPCQVAYTAMSAGRIKPWYPNFKNTVAPTIDPIANEIMEPARNKFARVSFLIFRSSVLHVVSLGNPKPKSVVRPVKWVVRTVLPEEEVIAPFCNPQAIQRSARSTCIFFMRFGLTKGSNCLYSPTKPARKR